MNPFDIAFNDRWAILRNDRDIRALAYSEDVWCTSNMNDKELRESIIQDILAFTMTGIETGVKFDLNEKELLKFVRPLQRQRIKEQMLHPDVQALITVENGIYRIRDNKAIRQAAMDMCGIWYDSYTAGTSEDDVIIKVSRTNLDELVEKAGGIENLAKSLAMDLEATVPGSTVFEDTDTINMFTGSVMLNQVKH